jgi:uncharacterized membrane protein YraQ (UPF0718 family)
MKRSTILKILLIASYFIFIGVSWLLGFNPGQQIGQNFAVFSVDMLKILPGAFILIGLFEVWVKRETVERHLGEGSGFRGYLWMILLGSTAVGGLYLAFPVAYTLYNKGAKLSVIFTYLGAAAICRIPMTIFEASFLGIKFTAIRWLVSLPLVIITSILLGNYLTRRGYRVEAGK